MDVFEQHDLEAHIVHELIDDIEDHYQICENCLMALERQPDDTELVHRLFRSVHTIKGDLGVVAFVPAIPLVSATEDLLGLLRQGQLRYDPSISDLVLLMLDRVRAQVETFRAAGRLEYLAGEFDALPPLFAALAELPRSQQLAQIAAVIRQFDPSVVDADSAEQSRLQADDFLQQLELGDDADLHFFRDLMAPVEARSPYWLGRGDRILKMALILNQLGGSPVDKQQLAVATYVHDFGMAFMPLSLLHKVDALSAAEVALLRGHVDSGAQLLQHLPQWQPAAQIVMQHHEAVDGSGYPAGLSQAAICDGAKILAIADTFDALTHQRAHAAHQRRPIIRAVKEINDCAGTRLCARWVAVFNQAVAPVLQTHRARHNQP